MTAHILVIGACFWSAWQILRRATWRRAAVGQPRAGHSEAPPPTQLAKRLGVRMGIVLRHLDLNHDVWGTDPDKDSTLMGHVDDELSRLAEETGTPWVRVTGGRK